MDVDQIKNIEELIKLPPGKKIKSHKVTRLTAPGENYGSLMLSVDVTIETPSGTETLVTVAKMAPPNDFMQEIFNTQVTFRNEIAFYKTIVPLLQNFQREHGITKVIDFAAKYYGSRLNLNDTDTEVDSDGALIVENLKVEGYTTLDRLEALDLEAAKLVLVNLAQFHAVPLALRLQKPEVFEKNIKPYMYRMELKQEQLADGIKNQKKFIEGIPELKPLQERILQGLQRVHGETKEPRELFATIVHNDMWTNNAMFKLDGSKIVKNKIVDYQILNYGSPARDVVFFIFSSLKPYVIDKNYDYLIKLYHQTFVSTLKELHCDVTPYTFEAFQKEIDIEARETQFSHTAFMVFPIYAPKGSVKEISEFTEDDMMKNAQISDSHKQRYLFVYKEFAKRNWI